MKKRVLFACAENANRSRMAEAFARLHGADASWSRTAPAAARAGR